MFSIQQLDLNFSQHDLQNFENRSNTNVFMSKMNFEKGFCISRGDKP